MTQIPAGWYPDPGAPPGTPPGLRWWDGTQWTSNVQPPQQPVQQPVRQPVSHDQPPPYQQTYGQPGAVATPPAYGVRGSATTPDGQRLAGWWHRVLAFAIDAVILLVLSGLVAFPFTSRLLAAYADFFDQTMRAMESGGQPPGQADLLSNVAGPLLGYAVIALVVNLVYNAVFLKALSATPGKLVTGLRVRLRDQPGPLSWGTVLTRWAAQHIGGLVGLLPAVGALGTLYALLDGLWPLRDQRKQALHDKIARTNVVRKQG